MLSKESTKFRYDAIHATEHKPRVYCAWGKRVEMRWERARRRRNTTRFLVVGCGGGRGGGFSACPFSVSDTCVFLT